MLNFNFINKNQIKATALLDTTRNYLVSAYRQTVDVFTYASSFGQILLTTQNLFSIVMYYIGDSITEMNIATARRAHTIWGNARMQGHSAMRGKSAFGEITLRFNGTIQKTFTGNIVYVPNYSRLTCKNNGLQYLLNLGADSVTVDITVNQSLRMRVVEGSLESQLFTGTGESLQTYEASTTPSKMIEDDFVLVTVNGEKYEVFDSLLDIPYKAKGCLIKTGMTSGIDVIFGNKYNHTIPALGAQIRVDYLLTNGVLGNMLDKTTGDFTFVDSGLDSNGAEVNLNNFFSIHVELPMDFGANAEDPELTKVLAPNISRNFIIHDEKSIKYFLGRMNYFSIIKVFKTIYDNNNQYSVMLVPDLPNRLNPGEDYFSIDKSRFTLNTVEETRLVNMIEETGRKSGNINISLLRPVLRKAVMVLIIEAFEKYNGKPVTRDDVRKEVRPVISDYLFKNSRVNKIPHSDIVKIIDNIGIIDTVKVIFVAEHQEDIDTKGNLIVTERSMILIRGGFTDSEGVTYEDEYDPLGEPLGSVNLDISFVPNLL